MKKLTLKIENELNLFWKGAENTMDKIFFLDDDPDIRYTVERYLTKRDYFVQSAENIHEAKKVYRPEYDVVVLDLNLPDGYGMKFFEYIKSLDNTPVICLTVKDDEKGMLSCFEEGVDDYITKPFSFPLLQARIKAVIVRTKPIRYRKKGFLYFDSLILDKNTMVLKKHGKKIALSPQELELMILFMKNPHLTIPRQRILESVWDIKGNYVNDNTLTATIKRIRDKLGKNTILTVRGIGYRLGRCE